MKLNFHILHISATKIKLSYQVAFDDFIGLCIGPFNLFQLLVEIRRRSRRQSTTLRQPYPLVNRAVLFPIEDDILGGVDAF